MFGFLWDLYQQEQIGNVRLDAERAQRTASQSAESNAVLEAKINRLELVCAAMHSLLQERLGITDTQIADRVRELDMLDGKLDGRMKLPATTCQRCGRAISAHRGFCIYCGK